MLQALGRNHVEYFQTLRRGDDGFESLLRNTGAMIASGTLLDISNINAEEVVDGLECGTTHSHSGPSHEQAAAYDSRNFHAVSLLGLVL